MLKDLISVHARLMVLFINNIMNNLIKIAVAASVIVCGGCRGDKGYEMGTYGYDLNYLAEHNVSVVELQGNNGKSRLMVIPAWQGRVMTSTTDGNEGISYGWINYRFINTGEVNPQFNPFG